MAGQTSLVINQPQSGKLICKLRLKTGLTQKQFATRLGVTYLTINRWENTHNNSSPLAMQKIVEILQEMGITDLNLLLIQVSQK